MTDTLTPRQIDVLRHLAQGMTNAEIADALCVTLRTVLTHTTDIYTKLGVGSRTEAVILALGTCISLDDAQAAVRQRINEVNA